MAAPLAKKVRGTVTSEEFDLNNMADETTTLEFVTKAFTDPLKLPDMIRFTFLVGGGKSSRQKYNDALPKWLSAALREIGFSEDRGGSCVMSSAGTFKQQHDTGKNLLYIHVFPLVDQAKDGGGGGGTEEYENSLEFSVARASLASFKEDVLRRTPSFNQKERLVAVLKKVLEEVEGVNVRVASDYNAVLSPVERLLLESLTTEGLTEKITLVRDQMKAQVEEGRLTDAEVKSLSEDVHSKIGKVKEEMAKPENASKGKLLDKFRDLLAKEEAKLVKLSSVKAISHPLERGLDVWRLKEDLDMVEKKSKEILSLEEIRKLPKKDELEREVDKLLKKGRCFFETDEEFDLRVLQAKPKAVKKKAAPPSTAGWTTVTAKNTAPAKNHTRKKNIGGGFGALSLDDSDDD